MAFLRKCDERARHDCGKIGEPFLRVKIEVFFGEEHGLLRKRDRRPNFPVFRGWEWAGHRGKMQFFHFLTIFFLRITYDSITRYSIPDAHDDFT